MGSTNPEFLAECAMARIKRGYLYGADMASSREFCFDDAVALANRIIALRTAERAEHCVLCGERLDDGKNCRSFGIGNLGHVSHEFLA